MNGFGPLTLIFCTFVLTWMVFSLRVRRHRTLLQWLSVLFDACATALIVMFASIGVWTVAALDMPFIGGGVTGLVVALSIMTGWVIISLGVGREDAPAPGSGGIQESTETPFGHSK